MKLPKRLTKAPSDAAEGIDTAKKNSKFARRRSSRATKRVDYDESTPKFDQETESNSEESSDFSSPPAKTSRSGRLSKKPQQFGFDADKKGKAGQNEKNAFESDSEEDLDNRYSTNVSKTKTAAAKRPHKRNLRRRLPKKKKSDSSFESNNESLENEDDDDDYTTTRKKLSRRKANGRKKSKKKAKARTATPAARSSSRVASSSNINYEEAPSEESDWFMTDDEEADYAEEEEEEEDEYQIETILNVVSHTRAEWDIICKNMNTSVVVNGSIWKSDEEEISEQQVDEDELIEKFCVKWKGYSYLHVSWETGVDLRTHLGRSTKKKTSVDSRIKHILKKVTTTQFKYKIKSYGERGFNALYQKAERIIDAFEAEDEKRYLVKWCFLPYNECTVEIESDIKTNPVNDFNELYESYLARNSPKKKIKAKKLVTLDAEAANDEKAAKLKDSLQNNEFKNGNKLRSYQIEAVQWLLVNALNGRSSILADEMGLGKTCQSVIFLNYLKNSFDYDKPFLIVAPLSTLNHWQREVETWTDMNCILYHGNKDSLKTIRDYEFYYDSDRKKKNRKMKIDCLITNFEMITNDDFLKDINWGYLVVDEAHKLKNINSKLTRCLLDNYNFQGSLLLTGTPIQNNLPELFTLLHFIAPSEFTDSDKFVEEFGNMTTSDNLDALHAKLAPYLLRRLKNIVEKNLPPKEEVVIQVELTNQQKKFYRAIYEKNSEYLTDNIAEGSKVNFNNISMQLRKCCCHPYLLDGAEAKYLEDHPVDPGLVLGKSREDRKKIEKDHAMTSLINASGKLILLDKLLPKLKADGHRVLIFSQMVRVLNLLEDYLEFRHVTYERIDGSVSGIDRQAAIDRFQKSNSMTDCFLLSTRGCGQGINLTAADTVIMFDNDWNPQNDIQAFARCHRIGQTKPVTIYRLVTRKSYEMTIWTAASKKLGLDRAIMNRMESLASEKDDDIADLRTNPEEIESLLKYGAYALTESEEQSAKDEQNFRNSNIEDILKSSLKVSSTEEQKPADGKSLMNKFSTATFVSDSSTELNIHDENFWSKIVGLKPKKAATSSSKRACRAAAVDYSESAAMYAVDESLQESEEDENIYIGNTLVTVKQSLVIAVANKLLQFGYGNWQVMYDLLQPEWKYMGDEFTVELVRQIATGITLISCIHAIDETSEDTETHLSNEELIEHVSKKGYQKKHTAKYIEFIEQGKDAIEKNISKILLDNLSNDSGYVIPFCSLAGKLGNALIRSAGKHIRHLEDVYHIHHFVKQIESGSLVEPNYSIKAFPYSWWNFDLDKELLKQLCYEGYSRHLIQINSTTKAARKSREFFQKSVDRLFDTEGSLIHTTLQKHFESLAQMQQNQSAAESSSSAVSDKPADPKSEPMEVTESNSAADKPTAAESSSSAVSDKPADQKSEPMEVSESNPAADEPTAAESNSSAVSDEPADQKSESMEVVGKSDQAAVQPMADGLISPPRTLLAASSTKEVDAPTTATLETSVPEMSLPSATESITPAKPVLKAKVTNDTTNITTTVTTDDLGKFHVEGKAVSRAVDVILKALRNPIKVFKVKKIAAPKVPKVVNTDEWTAKERKLVYDTMMVFSLPQLNDTMFSMYCNLDGFCDKLAMKNKTKEQILEYTLELLSYCKSSEEHGALFSKFLKTDLSLPSEFKHVKGKHVLTATQIKLLGSRINLISDFHEKVIVRTDKSLMHIIKSKAKSFASQMKTKQVALTLPDWWSASHDLELLKAVKKLGFVKDFSAIWKDSDFQFKELFEKDVAAYSTKTKNAELASDEDFVEQPEKVAVNYFDPSLGIYPGSPLVYKRVKTMVENISKVRLDNMFKAKVLKKISAPSIDLTKTSSLSSSSSLPLITSVLKPSGAKRIHSLISNKKIVATQSASPKKKKKLNQNIATIISSSPKKSKLSSASPAKNKLSTKLKPPGSDKKKKLKQSTTKRMQVDAGDVAMPTSKKSKPIEVASDSDSEVQIVKQTLKKAVKKSPSKQKPQESKSMTSLADLTETPTVVVDCEPVKSSAAVNTDAPAATTTIATEEPVEKVAKIVDSNAKVKSSLVADKKRKSSDEHAAVDKPAKKVAKIGDGKAKPESKLKLKKKNNNKKPTVAPKAAQAFRSFFG